MRSLAAVALVSAGLLACSDDPPGSKHGGIINGVVDLGDPAVVALLAGDQPFCTGTVIAPGVVVTAAHCVIVDGSIVGPTAVQFGTEADGSGDTIAVEWTEPFPRWGPRLFFGDAALIGLATPTQVTPIPIRRLPIDPEVGSMMRFVGFGFAQVGATGARGTKLEGQAPLEAISPEFLVYGQVTCAGDSGGPALMVNSVGIEELVGLTSHGPATCEDYGDSFSTRVDTVAGWIDARLAVTSASCELDHRCVVGCAADPDCTCVSDGRCDQCADREDPDCALGRIGDHCDGPNSCTPGAFCVDGRCGRACTPGACPSEESCESGDGEPRLVCIPAFVPTTEGCTSSSTPLPGGLGFVILALLELRRRRR